MTSNTSRFPDKILTADAPFFETAITSNCTAITKKMSRLGRDYTYNANYRK